MRIIAGKAGRIAITVPSAVARPTTDQVRQAIFSILGESPVDADVLDLFCGSGALGLEALSRGANSCDFVDESRHAISAVKKNLIKTKLKNAQLIQATASSHLLRCQKSYDLIFADPPYYKSSTDQNHIEELLHCEHLIQRLKPSGYLILEMSSKQQLPESALLETVTHRQYGATSVLFLTRR